jgi:hypothetical protein
MLLPDSIFNINSYRSRITGGRNEKNNKIFRKLG